MKQILIKLTILFFFCTQFSCKKFIQIEPPKNSLVEETVFQNDDQATSAVTGIYANMAASGYASGNVLSITALSGASSDELIGYNSTTIPYSDNQLTPDLSSISTLYSGSYKSIYTANSVIEGLGVSTGVTAPMKAQLQGEALFVRAFTYFYLVNLFGPVPLQLTTDYRITQNAPRSSVSKVYEQIFADLKLSESLLVDNYPSTNRVRPNRSAAQALLARVCLFTQDWENAEKYSSLVITKSSTYNLVNIDAVFLSSSQEAIWQLFPTANTTANDGNLFIPTITTSAPLVVSLRNSFATSAFEAGDKRQSNWIKTYSNSTGTYYYPYKYKIQAATVPTEYSMVLRLAEQFLIRAEARINQGKIDQGIGDLNIIRERARAVPTISMPNPLPPLGLNLNKADALLAVEQERKVELFTEWGHRWLDLKRTSRATISLGQIKLHWDPTDVLYPIPLGEISLNPNIIQNQGY